MPNQEKERRPYLSDCQKSVTFVQSWTLLDDFVLAIESEVACVEFRTLPVLIVIS